MNPILQNILVLIGSLFIGGIVNMGLVILGINLIPPPEGVDVMDPESFKAGIHLFQTKHFIFPFLAHAIGTLVGAFAVAKLAASHHLKLALGIGAFFLIGGIMAVRMNPGAPNWFVALDLIGAYLPMGWLGAKFAGRN